MTVSVSTRTAARSSHRVRNAGPASPTSQALRVRMVVPSGDDARFLQGMGDKARESRNPIMRALVTLRASFPRWSRILAIAFLGASLVVLGGVASSDRADAFMPPWEGWCMDWRLEMDKDDAREDSYGDTRSEDHPELADTTWAEYGMAGINWDGAFLDCDLGTWLFTGSADLLFRFPMWLTGFVIMFFQWTFQGHILNMFLEPSFGNQDAPLDIIVKALGGPQESSLFTSMTAVMVIIAAAVLFWRGIIKNSGLSDVLSKVVVIALVWAFALVFAMKAGPIVSWFNNNTNAVMGLTFSAFANATCEISPGNQGKCGKPENAKNNPSATSVVCVDTELDNDGTPRTTHVDAVDCIGQVMYHALVFMPWATGEVGPLVPSSVPDVPADASAEEKAKSPKQRAKEIYAHRMNLAMSILKWQAYSRTEASQIEGESLSGTPPQNSYDYQLAVPRSPGHEIQSFSSGCVRNHPKRQEFVEMMKLFGDEQLRKNLESTRYDRQESPNSVVTSTRETQFGDEGNNYLRRACAFTKAPDVFFDFNIDFPDGDDPVRFMNMEQLAYDYTWFRDGIENKEYFDSFSGYNGMQRFQTAVMALIAGLAMASIVGLVAVAYLILQIATVLFAMIAPLAALIGLIPVFGTRVFLKWAELFVGTFLKRIGLAVFVGFLMTLYTAVLLMPFQWYMQMVSLVGVALVGLVYRKKLFEVAGLGGIDSGLKGAAMGGGRAGFAVLGGAGKFGRNRVDGIRLRASRFMGSMEATKDTLGRKGPIGLGKRLRSASFGALKGGRASRITGELTQARYMGGQDKRQSWVKNEGKVKAYKESREGYEALVNQGYEDRRLGRKSKVYRKAVRAGRKGKLQVEMGPRRTITVYENGRPVEREVREIKKAEVRRSSGRTRRAHKSGSVRGYSSDATYEVDRPSLTRRRRRRDQGN